MSLARPGACMVSDRMRVDILGLQAFVSIAERGSFHAAASHLNLSQTALSHRIRKLEESIASPLFLRTTRQVTLTPTGSELLPKARRIFEDIGAAMTELRATAAATHEQVTLGCLPTVAVQFLPQVLRGFAERWPDVSVRVLDSSATEIADKVQAGEAEFGVTIVAANRWNLELKPVAREPFMLVCHRSLPIAAESALTWAQLQGLPLVMISAETGNRILIDDALGARRETLCWRYEARRVTTAVSLARSSVAAVIVPQLAYDVAEMAELVAIPLRSPTVTRTLGIVTRQGSLLSPPARTLLDMMTAALRARFDKPDAPADS
jgi:DNA-binding transcriptional LysR family regulator